MLYLEGKFFLADHNLNYTDKMSMASGVEVRVPLLDPQLVELAVRRVVHGQPVENREALANPEALDLFASLTELQT